MQPALLNITLPILSCHCYITQTGNTFTSHNFWYLIIALLITPPPLHKSCPFQIRLRPFFLIQLHPLSKLKKPACKWSDCAPSTYPYAAFHVVARARVLWSVYRRNCTCIGGTLPALAKATTQSQPQIQTRPSAVTHLSPHPFCCAY